MYIHDAINYYLFIYICLLCLLCVCACVRMCMGMCVWGMCVWVCVSTLPPVCVSTRG